ncbi:MAG: hypothetical protein R3Y24_05510 [Eubacteriales bacterium]
MTDNYQDILHLPHHVSTKHPPMSLMDRAAQFAPFAALTGHDVAIKETARLTDRRLELDELEQEALREKLNDIMTMIDSHPQVTLTYFQPDGKKDGGVYLTVTGYVKKIAEHKRVIYMMDGVEIPIVEIIAIESDGY